MRATEREVIRVARRRWLKDGRLDMGELAAETGLSRATLYRRVQSRERLLGEIVWTLAEAAFSDALARTRGAGPDYVTRVIARYLTGAAAYEPVRRFIAQDPEYALRVLASKHSPMQMRSIDALRALLAEQVEGGHLEPALSIDDMAYLVVRIAESYLYSDVITGTEPDVDKAVDAINALLHAAPVSRQRR